MRKAPEKFKFIKLPARWIAGGFKKIVSLKSFVTWQVGISLVVSIVFSVIVAIISRAKGDNSMEFWEGVRVESYGMVMDLWVIGTFLLFLNEIANRRNENKRYEDEIDDFREWESDEAKYRILGSMKRLSRNGVSKMELSGCYLKGVNFEKINLSGSSFVAANLEGAYFERADLSSAKFYIAILKEATLKETNLTESSFFMANLLRADFSRANLKDVDFREADLSNVDFREANLQGADLQKAILLWAANLTIEQLFLVKSLYKTKLDKDLAEKVVKQCPHLLEKPRK